MSEVATIESWEELVELDDADYATVKVGGKQVRLASLSSSRMMRWFEDNRDPEKANDNGLVLIAESIVNSTGKRIGKLDQILKLRDKNPETVMALRDACIRLNRLTLKDEQSPNASSEPVVQTTETSTSGSPTD